MRLPIPLWVALNNVLWFLPCPYSLRKKVYLKACEQAWIRASLSSVRG